MGFDVTATNAIFFIALLTVGSATMSGYWKGASYVEDARRLQDDRVDERARTNMSITSATYAPGPSRWTINLKNDCSTVIDLSELVYMVDGVPVPSSSIESVDVTGVGGTTDVWLPTESLVVKLKPISNPKHFQIVAENGARANHQR